MAKVKTVYCCNACGYQTARWLGRCPDCGSFNTLTEELYEKAAKKQPDFSGYGGYSGSGGREVTLLKDISPMAYERTATGITELDRALSGGIVKGSVTLLGGEPGIGKSTLLLQICESIGKSGVKVLYISGEESLEQIKMRAERLNVATENLLLLAETSMDVIEGVINEIKPGIIIVDSIQTMCNHEISSSPGAVSQVRECTASFIRICKGMNISVFLVGHVTKDGSIAGPKILEHMVDTVLYFEGEKKELYRVIRAVKNRFGSTNEIGVFEMGQNGLTEIPNPSEYMLFGRPKGVSGSAVTCAVEGTRPILAEVQALVTYTSYGMARRAATGLDVNRVTMLIAVLEKRAGLTLGNYDSYVNVAGGMKLLEPALDAAVAAVIAGSFRNKAIDPSTIIFGEVGLTGEIRSVSMADTRVMEAAKLGFKQCIIPQGNLKAIKRTDDIRVMGIGNVAELLVLCFG